LTAVEQFGHFVCIGRICASGGPVQAVIPATIKLTHYQFLPPAGPQDSFSAVAGARTAFRAGNAPAALLESWRARPSIECDAKPVFFAPNNPALPGDLIGLNDQLKFVGNAERTWNVKGGAEL
jgi:hypothetical protein